MNAAAKTHAPDCACADCIAEFMSGDHPPEVERVIGSSLLPAHQEAIVADALVDLVVAWESKQEGHADYIEPRLWLRRMELSVGYARQVLADSGVEDARLLRRAAPEA